MSTTGWTAGGVLEQFRSELVDCADVALEFSIRLQPGRVQAWGRFGCWLEGTGAPAFQPIRRVLARIGAPPSVLQAQDQAALPRRQGIAVSLGEGEPEFRLYLHGRRAETLADQYEAWRWTPGHPAERSTYAFAFLPETASGRRPVDLVDDRLRPAFAKLLADTWLRQGSGFWLRTRSDGTVDQLDLAFPWSPVARSLPGVRELECSLELTTQDTLAWQDLPVRHIATHVGSAWPTVTLYASAPGGSAWPTDEGALQLHVRRGATQFNREVLQQVYRPLQELPEVVPTGVDLDSFYGGAPAVWRRVLGPKLHYHAGLFEPGLREPDDAAMDEGLDRAVTELYPFVPAGGRVYDIGCGWGGALGMWIRDLACPSLGLTISRAQFRYVAGLGLPVRWGDAERTLPPGRFECAILLESLCHMTDKQRLLRVLRLFAGRLIMRVNCQDDAPGSTAFGDTLHMVSSTELRRLLATTGWRIKHWRDRRPEALPSVGGWHRRLQRVAASDDPHLEVLRAWCARVMLAPEAWAAHNPLIEVVADPD